MTRTRTTRTRTTRTRTTRTRTTRKGQSGGGFSVVAIGFAVVANILLVTPVLAAEATLKAISAYPRGNTWSVPLEKMIDKVNAEGKGIVQIKYLGGSESMHPFEVGNAVKNGVVDIADVTSAYYATLMPESLTLLWTPMDIHQLRKSSAWSYVQNLYGEKMNSMILAQLDMSTTHLWLREKKLTTPDFSGLKIRGNSLYRPFLEKFGATVVRMPLTDIYTALERGVIDGFGYPLVGMESLGLHKFTKYRVEPSITRGPTEILMNVNSWKKLDQKQRNFLQKMALWLERDNDLATAEATRKSRALQTAAGIQSITLGADYLKTIQKISWAEMVKQSPVHAPRLRKLLKAE